MSLSLPAFAFARGEQLDPNACLSVGRLSEAVRGGHHDCSYHAMMNECQFYQEWRPSILVG